MTSASALLKRLQEVLARFTAGGQPKSLAHAVRLVDEVLLALGLEVEAEVSEQGFDWSIQVGSADLTISIQHNDVLDDTTLAVSSAILRVPLQNTLAFYRRCLELNRILVGCSIGVDGDQVMVAAERLLASVDRPALVRMLLNVASAADQFDDELAAEFGAEKLGED